jgi:predicted nucleotidyltransferase component of viral defense system
VKTYHLEELLGTKLRALYQRRKGRDLYDLWLALTTNRVSDERVVECMNVYLKAGKQAISRAQFEQNLIGKMDSAAFINDLTPLLREGGNYNVHVAAQLVSDRLIAKMSGAPWKRVKKLG